MFSCLTGWELGEECRDCEGLSELSPVRPASLRLAAVHSLNLELSDDTDQLCNLETLFMVTNMASSLMYARNQLVIPPVTSYVWLSYSISL